MFTGTRVVRTESWRAALSALVAIQFAVGMALKLFGELGAVEIRHGSFLDGLASASYVMIGGVLLMSSHQVFLRARSWIGWAAVLLGLAGVVVGCLLRSVPYASVYVVDTVVLLFLWRNGPGPQTAAG